MPLYEHTVIARPDLTNQQAQDLATVFSEVITTQGGTVGKTEYWGLRNLSYRVKKHRKGHYLHLNLDAPVGGDHRAGAPAADPRGRAALPDRAGRGASRKAPRR